MKLSLNRYAAPLSCRLPGHVSSDPMASGPKLQPADDQAVTLRPWLLGDEALDDLGFDVNLPEGNMDWDDLSDLMKAGNIAARLDSQTGDWKCGRINFSDIPKASSLLAYLDGGILDVVCEVTGLAGFADSNIATNSSNPEENSVISNSL